MFLSAVAPDKLIRQQAIKINNATNEVSSFKIQRLEAEKPKFSQLIKLGSIAYFVLKNLSSNLSSSNFHYLQVNAYQHLLILPYLYISCALSRPSIERKVI